MKIIKTWLNLCDGTEQEFNVLTDVAEFSDVYAVKVKGFAKMPLNEDFGVGIDFTVD